MSGDPPSVLLLIIDIHPISWAISADPTRQPLSEGSNGNAQSQSEVTADTLDLPHALDQLLVFLSAHLAMKWGNELVVYVAMANGKSHLLYSSQAPTPSLSNSLSANSYEPFHTMSETIRSRLNELMREQAEDMEKQEREGNGMEVEDQEDSPANGSKNDIEGQQGRGGPAIVPALLRALCHVNRIHPSDTFQHSISMQQSSTTGQYGAAEGEENGAAGMIKPRIMIVNNTAERGSGGYVGLMNAVFAAQKRKTPIDVINLHSTDSIFLQQAAHLTQGVYYRIPKKAGFLMYLHLMFLTPPHLRDQVGLPSQDKVDFRAVCFCHQRVVDIGFVCSVCLSIFCAPQASCSTCKSKFPIATIQHLRSAYVQPTIAPKKRIVMVGVGGPTCSGKTLLAKHLARILGPDRCLVMHQDDYAPAQELIPYHPDHPDTQDWDTPQTAINWPLFRRALGHAHQTGENLPDHAGHDHLNKQVEVGISEELEKKWRGEFERLLKEGETKGEEVKFVLVDGFLLYWDEACASQYDIKLFLRVPYQTLRNRREARRVYVTQSGDAWQDPPNYFDNIVYPAYMVAHQSMFSEGDVENGTVKEEYAGGGLRVIKAADGSEGMEGLVEDSLKTIFEAVNGAE